MSKRPGTARIASWRATARARACISSTGPPKARVMRWSRSSRTSSEKPTPVAAAIARTASWTGFPSQMPQVARGSPMRRALCSSSVVSIPARPGATILGPPLKPAKKCGSTNPVVMRRSAETQARAATGTSPTMPRSTRLVARCVIDHAAHRQHARRRASTTLLGRAGAMGAGGDEHDDIVGTDDPVELFHDGLQHQLARLRPGDVAHRDRDRLPGRMRSRSGGPATGRRIASRSVAIGSVAAARAFGRMTVASEGRSTSSPSVPYARWTQRWPPPVDIPISPR